MNDSSKKNIYAASGQWASRPDDERFESLDALRTAVATRKVESWTIAPKTNELRVNASSDALDASITVDMFDYVHGEQRALAPTHWAFNQLAQYAGAPASYLRKLPAMLAAMDLQWGLDRIALREDVLVLGQTNGSNVLRSMTSPSYGRIWDLDVVDAVIRMNNRSGGIWHIPAASYATQNPKRATTLYASDRDVFLFLVDDSHPIEVPGEDQPMFRGFITWNSEVGSAVFGLMTFLYERVCDNRIIWNASNVRELRIRHTGGAPERFLSEAQGYLTRYANEGTRQIVDGIVKAKETEIDLTESQPTVTDWLMSRGFTKVQAQASVQSAQAEQGDVRSVFDIVQGITAHARSITHADERVKLEQQAGALLSKYTR